MRFLAAALPIAALLLSPIAAPAQTPKPLPANAAELKYRTIILRHTAPLDVLKVMHWETVDMDPFKPVQVPQPINQPYNVKLPDGVARIFALQSSNALLLEATDAGYKQVQEIVKTLDVAPQQVRLTVRFVAVPLSQKLTVDSSNSSQASQQLQDAKALFYQPLSTTTDNDKPASFPLYWHLLDNTCGPTSDALATVSPSKPPALRLIPRINRDTSVTISLNTEEQNAHVLPALQTVFSGKETVYDVTLWVYATRHRVFLFVTPTLVNDDAGAGANGGTINIKP